MFASPWEDLMGQIRAGRKRDLQEDIFEGTTSQDIIEPDFFSKFRTDNLLLHFNGFFNNELCSDFKFILKRENPTENFEVDSYGNCRLPEIYVHKFVLAQSEWFRAIFDSNMVEQMTNVMVVSDLDENLDAFTAMISMMYGNYVPTFKDLDTNLVVELLICFDKYQLTDLFDKLIKGLAENIQRNSGSYKRTDALLLYSLFGEKIKAREISSIIIKYASHGWSFKSNERDVLDGMQLEFANFINGLDYDTFYFFLERFILPSHHFTTICVSIDEWTKQDETTRYQYSYLLLRVALQKSRK